MTGVQTCALPICFPVTISGDRDIGDIMYLSDFMGGIRAYAGQWEGDKGMSFSELKWHKMSLSEKNVMEECGKFYKL